MLNLSNFFELLKDRGIAADISKATGISSGNISDWKSGRSKPTAETLIKIAEYFNCSIDFLLGRTNVKEFVKTPTSVKQIKIFSQRAAAGIGKEAVSDNIEQPKIKWFYEDQVPSGVSYGIAIEGNSMETKFHSGQTVFVKLIDDCHDGDYGIFTITDKGETNVYFKQKKMNADGSYVLHSLNTKEYPDIADFKNKIVRCIAVAVV